MSIESSLFAFPVLSYQHLKIAINASMGESDVLEFRFYALLFYRSAFFSRVWVCSLQNTFFVFFRRKFFGEGVGVMRGKRRRGDLGFFLKQADLANHHLRLE